MIDIGRIFREPTLLEWRQSIIDADLEGVFDIYSADEVVTKFQLAFEEELTGHKLDAETIAFWREQLRGEIVEVQRMREHTAIRPLVTIGSVIAGIGVILVLEHVILGPEFGDLRYLAAGLLFGTVVYVSAYIVRARKKKDARLPEGNGRLHQ